VNDLNNYIGTATCNMYADDVLIYCSGNNINEVSLSLQQSIDNVQQWYDNNLMVVNTSKSNVMLVTTRQRETIILENIENDVPLKVIMNDADLKYVDQCKYLGVHVDKNLTWCVHVDVLCRELNYMVWTLSRLRCILPHESLIQIYISIVQPKIDYAITVWGYTSEQNIDKVQRMQNRAIRAMLNNYDFVNVRGTDLVAQLKLLNVRQRRDYFMSLLIFKCIHGLAPTYLCNEVIMAIEVRERNTRNVNENDLYVPGINLNCTKNAFSHCGPTMWNSLPNDMKECASIDVFKAKARKYFLTQFNI
jgi:hypothetical protein